MTKARRDRLLKLESRRKAAPELRCFWQADGETWDQLKERARAWQAERPEARWPSPLLVGRREEA